MAYETFSLIDGITSILRQYPFGVGLFREILQNSDDAKARKQVFVLDLRKHPTSSLYHPDLADTQGPALLAFNDAEFTETDWKHIRSIQNSSKKTDTSKIGKYGIGFRSCYHVTDTPQILSGSKLAIFDPCHHTLLEGGADFDFVEKSPQYSDQLSAFDGFIPSFARTQPFPGTIVRLPLRTPAIARTSGLGDKAIDPEKIRQLLLQFIQGEMDITMLFLSNVTCIEIYEIDEQGIRQEFAKAEITKEAPDSFVPTTADVNVDTRRAVVKVTIPGAEDTERTWRILHACFPESQSAALLRSRYEGDPTSILDKNKLLPNVGIAIPLSSQSPSTRTNIGRLFTFLPLPIHTDFPCHVHALFALKQDRQGLKHGDKVDLSAVSDDCALIEWNNILFDVYIPSAWAMLLSILIANDKPADIFQAWPPSQPFLDGSDSAYRHSMPGNVLRAILQDHGRVWPVVGFDIADNAVCISDTEATQAFSDIHSVLVSSDRDDDATVAALAVAGISMTRPPQYVIDLLQQEVDFDQLALTPTSVHQRLLTDIPRLFHLYSYPLARANILSYLTSSGDVRKLVGVPLVPVTTGELVALEDVQSAMAHTLLTENDLEQFREFDQTAIPLNELPSSVAKLLVDNGPSNLNVIPLGCKQVVQYLRLAFGQFGLTLEAQPGTEVSTIAVDWLKSFWEWMSESYVKLPLEFIPTFSLLPTSKNTLQSLKNGVFARADSIDPSLHDTLEQIGIYFLHLDVSIDAQRLLERNGAIRKPTVAHHILDNIAEPIPGLAPGAADSFRDHLLSCLVDSTRLLGPLNTEQKRKLRSLPIYPILAPPTSGAGSFNAIRELASIPEGKTVESVVDMGLLPLLEDVVFLDGCRDVLRFIQSYSRKIMRASDVLSLAVEHFVKQPCYLQRAFLEYIDTHPNEVTVDLPRRISKTPFVAVCGGQLEAPKDVFDPTCQAASLFHNDRRCPRLLDDDDSAIIRSLSSFGLGLLKSKLDNDIIHERISHISQYASSQESITLARRLLQLIIETNYDCSKLSIDPGLQWLPTSHGLVSSKKCCHPDVHSRDLFDEVLSVLDIEHLPMSLRKALGWDETISLSIVKKQLEKVLELGERHQKLQSIIQELGRRNDWLACQDELRHLISERPWIPINQHCLATTSRAVLSPELGIPPGFHAVPSNLADDSGVREFLKLMGCTESPSSAALIQELDSWKERESRTDKVTVSLQLLEMLVAKDLHDDEYARILIPDESGCLLPSTQIYFNDIGARAMEIKLPGNLSRRAHPNITHGLAESLRLNFIGHSALNALFVDDGNMGESLTTRIVNVLLGYQKEHFLGEFLANAEDANAKTFAMLLDERPAPSAYVLSPDFAKLQSYPSLVIYNDSIFTESDFMGIRNVGLGGKIDKPDTIGQFGLGCLSMYHFTDVAMVVSGDKVLFLDPSRQYIHFGNQPSLLTTISAIRQFYGDHLAPLSGLYGFDMNKDYYSGTLFRLPLKTGLSGKVCSVNELRGYIEEHYLDMAPQALLFTNIDKIAAEHLDTHDQRSEYWSIEVNREQLTREGVGELQILHVKGSNTCSAAGEWLVTSRKTEKQHIPEQFHALVQEHRLRNPICYGLAARVTAPISKPQLFATIPLPILSNLPVHLNATFILSSDRRQIRFDDNLQREYNSWLLSCMLPPLYLSLLEELLEESLRRYGRTDSSWWQWWPGSSITSQDPISKVLIDSLYSAHIASTEKRICLSVTGERLPPRDAVFLDANSESAEGKLLLHLQPPKLVQIPSSVRNALGDRIKVVDRDFVREVILQNVDRVQEAYTARQMTVRDVQNVVRFLLESGVNAEGMVGLPLLPLANSCLGTFGLFADTTCYCAWKPSRETRSLFPPERLIHPDFKIDEFPTELNISKLNGSMVGNLLKDRLSVAAERDSMSAEDCSWVASFWAEYQQMDVDSDDISHFPLVPTMTTGSYISLEKCGTDTVILLGTGLSEREIAPVLSALGATIVRKDRCPTPLCNILNEEPFSRFNLDTVLRFFKTVDSPIANRFRRLSVPDRQRFALWVKQKMHNITGKIPKKLLPIAQHLPIWMSLQPGRNNEGSFLAASEIVMLPDVFSERSDDILRFLHAPPKYVIYSPTLHFKLDINPLSMPDFWDRLALSPNKILPQNHIFPYKRLLRIIITDPELGVRNVLVPNSNGVLENARDLYARSEQLFSEAFRTPPYLRKLVHLDFQDLEDRLGEFGLRTKIEFNSFKACIAAIHEDIDGNCRVDRARSIYQWYCNELPVELAPTPQRYRELDSFRFIPPATDQRSTSFDQTRYIRRSIRCLDLLAPKEVLRPEHEAIAWTQRALFSPSERLLVGDLQLGVPTPAEVFQHLRVLTREIAPKYPSDFDLLSDIKKTYQWLTDHNSDTELRDLFVQTHTEALFLNVDDPEQTSWIWRSADELYFNISDSPSSNCWGVRRFLMPFESLLRLAGVQEVRAPTVPDLPVSSKEAQLILFRASFDAMRHEGTLTDVRFKAEDGVEFPAHRAFLATTSDHFRDLFCGGFEESGFASAANPKAVEVPCPSDCLGWIIEYLYTEAFPPTDNMDSLLHILHLAHQWQILSLNKAMQVRLIPHITMDTYEELREETKIYPAEILIEKCDLFELENHDAIARFQGRDD